MGNEIKTRNTYLDLLRVVAIFLIVISHVYDLLFVNMEYNTIADYFTYMFYHLFGNTGNLIFITCSAFYLIKSKGPRLNKIIFLILIQIVTAALMLLVIHYLNIDIVNIHWLKRTLFPYLTGVTYWYINAYIIYYMIHGFLNVLIHNISKSEHKLFVIIGMIYFMILPVFFKGPWNNISAITNFVLIHFIVSYVDKYMKNFDFNKSTKIFGSLYFIILLAFIIIDIVLKINKYKYITQLHTWKYFNVVLVMFIVSLVFNEKNVIMKPNSIISIISSLSLYIYLIHCYETSRNVITAGVFENTVWPLIDGRFSYSLDRLVYFGLSVLYFLTNIPIAFIYKKLVEPILQPLSNKISDKLRSMWAKLEEKYDR